MRSIQRVYTTSLADTAAELCSACRIAADMIDAMRPDMRAADMLALEWLAFKIEDLAENVAECGGPAGLAEAGMRLADAAMAVDGRQDVRAVQSTFDRVEALASLAAALLFAEHGRGGRITSAWECPEAQPRG